MKNIRKNIDKLKKQKDNFEFEAVKRTVGYIIAAFGFVAALAWNDFAKAFIQYIFPVETDSLLAKALYAVLITLFVVFVTMYVSKLNKKDEKK